jgi:hypothetical protein
VLNVPVTAFHQSIIDYLFPCMNKHFVTYLPPSFRNERMHSLFGGVAGRGGGCGPANA